MDPRTHRSRGGPEPGLPRAAEPYVLQLASDSVPCCDVIILLPKTRLDTDSMKHAKVPTSEASKGQRVSQVSQVGPEPTSLESASCEVAIPAVPVPTVPTSSR